MRQAGPTPPLRTLAALAAAGLVAVLALGDRTAGAGEPKPPGPKPTGNVKFEAHADPERVAPGGKGVVVIVGTIRKDVHVFSDKRFKVKPVPATGVTYGPFETSKHTTWTDPDDPEGGPSDVWFDKVEIRLPYTVALDAPFPLTVGAIIGWSACDKNQCYGPELTGTPVTVDVLAPAHGEPIGPVGPGNEGPGNAAPTADAPPAPAAAPAVAPASGPAPFDVHTVVKADDVTITVRATDHDVFVKFEPLEGRHIYAVGHAGGEHPVDVVGVAAAGVTWGELVAPIVDPTELHEAYELRLPYTDARKDAGDLEVGVSWQACLDAGTCHTPQGPHHYRVHREGAERQVTEVEVAAPPVPISAAGPVPGSPSPGSPGGAGGTPPAPRLGGPLREHGLLFPVIGTRGESLVDSLWRRLGILILGPLFLGGILLAFTPCVLPIIPITVSIIGGGRTDLTKSRLVLLLSCYVLGLSLAFGTMGIVAAKMGGSFAAAFQSPVALWAISGVFVLLAFGMLGLYELQLPASLQRLQGGAKGGSVIGAFLLGAIAALIASPCTGPVIAGLVVFTAQSGNVLMGFLMFAAMGLGMGSVFFAAGSLNLVMKPGPWMVWVRYGFGVMLIGIAIYYLASSGRLGSVGVFATGFALAALAAFGIARHLTHKEGEEPGRAATRGAQVAVLLVLTTGLVAFITRPPTPWHGKAGEGPITWTTVVDRASLAAEVEKAVRDGKPTVIDVWAEWCPYCKRYDRVIEESPQVKAGFQGLHRLRIDLTEKPASEDGLREGLDIPPNTQPFLVFLDARGRIRRALDVEKFFHDQSASELMKRLEAVEKEP